MKKAAFYQIQDGDTGAQVSQGLQGNFEALQQEIEAIPPYSLPIKMDPNSGIINSEEDYNSILPESYLTEYPWQAEYAGGLPWLWMNFKAKVSEGTQICIKHNNKFCEFHQHSRNYRHRICQQEDSDNEGEERISGFRVSEGFGRTESGLERHLPGLRTGC